MKSGAAWLEATDATDNATRSADPSTEERGEPILLPLLRRQERVNERQPAFEDEVRRWHATGRNIIAMQFWWTGQKGNEAALGTGTARLSDAETSASIFCLTQSVTDAEPSVWRIGVRAEQVQWTTPVNEQPVGPAVFLPTAWFHPRSRAVKKVPLFFWSLQLRLQKHSDWTLARRPSAQTSGKSTSWSA